jgi:TRAP-type C4-dicarboxylate transport system permease small subunit
VLAAALIAVLTLVVGWIVFARMERQVLKEI